MGCDIAAKWGRGRRCGEPYLLAGSDTWIRTGDPLVNRAPSRFPPVPEKFTPTLEDPVRPARSEGVDVNATSCTTSTTSVQPLPHLTPISCHPPMERLR